MRCEANERGRAWSGGRQNDSYAVREVGGSIARSASLTPVEVSGAHGGRDVAGQPRSTVGVMSRRRGDAEFGEGGVDALPDAVDEVSLCLA